MKDKKDMQRIYALYFHPEKSPGGTPDPMGRVHYTASQRTIDRRFSRDRSSLLWNPLRQGTFIGNLRKTFKY